MKVAGKGGIRARWGTMLVVLTAAPGAAQALGLGPLEVRSSLGEPLRAVAPLHIGANESLDKVEAGLADRQTYRDFDMSQPAVASRLRMQIVSNPIPHIRITSTDPVRAPMFDLLVRVGQEGTAILKEYSLALTPPIQGVESSQERARAKAAEGHLPASKAGSERNRRGTAQAGKGAPGVPRPEVEKTEGWAKRDRYGPVRKGDTLATIVERVRRTGSVPQASAVAATWAANKDAFIAGNMNRLRQGAVLTLPDGEAVRSYSLQEAKALIARQRKEWQANKGEERATNVGHRRYAVKVSVGAGASDTNGGDAAADQSESGASAADRDGSSGSAEDRKKPGPKAGQAPDTAEGGSTSEQAAEGEGGGASGSGAKGKGATEVADLRERIRDLQQAVTQLGSDSGGKVKALKDRVSGLQEQVRQQKALLQKQSRTLTQLNQRSSRSSRSQPLLWALGGLNLLLIGILGVLGAWLVRGRRGEAYSAGGSGEGSTYAAPVGGAASMRPTQAGEADPVTRVERHLAEGDTNGAKTVLETAIRADPWNWALYDRLLTLLEQDGEGERFQEVAQQLFRQLGEAHPAWQAAIRERGRHLLPNSPVFAEPGLAEGPSASEGGEESESEEELTFPGFKEASPESEPEPGPTTESDTEEAASDAQPPAEGEGDLGLTLDESDTQVPAQEAEEGASSEDTGKASAADESFELSFELEDESEAREDTPETDADQPDDEMAIKLDLAQAWLDMGDADSARPLLEEVLEKGDSDQQGQARRKLEGLG